MNIKYWLKGAYKNRTYRYTNIDFLDLRLLQLQSIRAPKATESSKGVTLETSQKSERFRSSELNWK